MRLIPLLMLLGGLPAYGDVAFYTIDFTATSGSPTPVGSFDYDPAIPEFTNFLVVWDGMTFDLTNGVTSANDPYYGGPSPCDGAPFAPSGFSLLTTCPGAYWVADAGGLNNSYVEFSDPTGTLLQIFGRLPSAGLTAAFATGSFSTVEVVPEPSTVALMLIGLGWLMRKRITHGFRQATHAYPFTRRHI
jgi:hypothetical protein